MIRLMRDKFGPVTIGILIGGIALVFIFFGVYSPRDAGSRGAAGTVNGESIPSAAYQREYDRRLEYFRNMGGGKLTPEQLKMFRIGEGVFEELATRKLLVQEATRVGLLPSAEEIRRKIIEIPAFQKDGRFDKIRYKQILEANNWTASEFEKSIKEDLAAEGWRRYFRELARPTPSEVDFEMEFARDQRVIEYVYLTPQAPKNPSEAELKTAQSDPAKNELARAKYESAKEAEYKGKKFEDVKGAILSELVQAQAKKDSFGKIERMAEEAQKLLGGNEAKMKTLLAGTEAKAQKSQPLNRKTNYLPGVGETRDLIRDAFASPQGSPAKVYRLTGGVLVARAILPPKETKAPTDAERKRQIADQLENTKMSALYEQWMKKLREGAKIKMSSWVKNSAES